MYCDFVKNLCNVFELKMYLIICDTYTFYKFEEFTKTYCNVCTLPTKVFIKVPIIIFYVMLLLLF